MKEKVTRCLLSCISVFIIFSSATAQEKIVDLFKSYKTLPVELYSSLHKGQTAVFNKKAVDIVLASRPSVINVSIQFEGKLWVLELVQNDIYSKGFHLLSGSDPSVKHPYKSTALNYKGRIRGKANSFVAISILQDKIMAVLSDEAGNINIGLINNTAGRAEGTHVIYRELDLVEKNDFICGVTDDPMSAQDLLPVYRPSEVTAATVNTEPIDIYFETDYRTYVNNGASITAVADYVSALFNVVHTVYENDSINVKFSALKVWDVPDPYVNFTTTATVLNAFSGSMSAGFPGDLSHFLSQRTLGGGIAYLNVLCSGTKNAVSGNLTNSFNTVPVYSWSTMVITHETGHNIGSPHTHNCGWPGGAIDNCYTTEGGCPGGPAPVNGGTIMSYCHLTSSGINFSRGFGLFPGTLVRSKVRNNTCIYPAVFFESTLQNIAEENADVADGCLDYKILTARISIPYAPTAPATVTLLPTGSAGLEIGPGKDVDLSPLIFTLNADTLYQDISLKIFNDGLVENTETLTLNFMVNANGGNAVKRNVQNTHKLNIFSLDHRPDSTVNQVLYRESFNEVDGGLGNWQQTVLHGQTSPNRWIIGNSGNALFPSAAAYISNNGSTWAYSGSTAGDSVWLRLSSPVINATGFSSLRISYVYSCAGEYTFGGGVGTGNGDVTGKDFGRLLYSADNGASWITLRDNITGRQGRLTDDIPIPADANNKSALKIAFDWRNNDSIVNNQPLLIDSILISGVGASEVQSAPDVGNVQSQNLGPRQTMHYYNTVTGKIMASIENLTTFDFGCTSVAIVKTGVGGGFAWDSLAAHQITDKVFHVVTTNSDGAASCKITLFYTSDEIAGWLNATGNQLGDLRMVKSSNDITGYSPESSRVFAGTSSVAGYGPVPHIAVSAVYTSPAFFALGKPVVKPECPEKIIRLASEIPGTSYQWQVDNGSGYTNMFNSGVIDGSAADTLTLNLPPTSWYGSKYRCLVNTVYGPLTSQEYELKFGMQWQGNFNTVWENPANWPCNVLPDENTDVIVNASSPNMPEVNGNASIRSLQVSPATNVLIKTGGNIIIKK